MPQKIKLIVLSTKDISRNFHKLPMINYKKCRILQPIIFNNEKFKISFLDNIVMNI